MNSLVKRIERLEEKLNKLPEPVADILTTEERARMAELHRIWNEERDLTIPEIREESRMMFKLQRAGCFSKCPDNLAERMREAGKRVDERNRRIHPERYAGKEAVNV